MNLVLDNSEEYNIKTNKRTAIGRIMLKGDNVALVCNISYLSQLLIGTRIKLNALNFSFYLIMLI